MAPISTDYKPPYDSFQANILKTFRHIAIWTSLQTQPKGRGIRMQGRCPSLDGQDLFITAELRVLF